MYVSSLVPGPCLISQVEVECIAVVQEIAIYVSNLVPAMSYLISQVEIDVTCMYRVLVCWVCLLKMDDLHLPFQNCRACSYPAYLPSLAVPLLPSLLLSSIFTATLSNLHCYFLYYSNTCAYSNDPSPWFVNLK